MPAMSFACVPCRANVAHPMRVEMTEKSQECRELHFILYGFLPFDDLNIEQQTGNGRNCFFFYWNVL